MASDTLRQSIEVASHRRPKDNSGMDIPSERNMESGEQRVAETMEDGEQSMQENCDNINSNGLSTRTSSNKAVAPFLSRHIPEQYAPLGMPQTSITVPKDPNTKYCYRHHPDSKCRRTPDEPTMENIQTQLETLSMSDRQAISHVWSLFSASPAKHRNLMLQGILTQCCFPQLSFLSTAVKDLIKIDFITALPSEISFKILGHLDTTSLCKAAQVSQRWRLLADDDVVWHKMCEQHVHRKCTKCGWGLPLLEKKQLRDWKREQQLRARARGLNQWSPRLTPAPENDATDTGKLPKLNGATKRDADAFASDGKLSSTAVTKRPCVSSVKEIVREEKATFRPWKLVYKDRYLVSTNWKYGRFSTKVLRGHTNGVMCLQFDDNIVATGSYDCTIKIWDIETGECLRTLTGHTECVRALQFDDSGKLISGSVDNTLKVWNWRTGECKNTMEGHTGKVIGLHYENRLLASASEDKSVIVWNIKTATKFCLKGHEDWVNAVRLDTASNTLFSASDDMTVRLWDLDTKRTIQVFSGHVAPVQQVLLLPEDYEPEELDADEDDDASSRNSRSPSPYPDLYAHWPSNRPRPPRYILTSSLDATIRLWCVETGRCLKKFFGHVEGVWGIAADTLRIVSCAQDRMVKVWDARTGKCDRTITGHEGPVTCIGLSDSTLVTASEDHTVRVLSFAAENHQEQ